VAGPDPGDIQNLFGGGGFTASYAQSVWDSVSRGKRILFSERAGSVEAALQKAAEEGKLGGVDDVVRLIHDFNYAKAAPGRAAALPGGAAARAEAAGLSGEEVPRLAREAGERAFGLPLPETPPASPEPPFALPPELPSPEPPAPPSYPGPPAAAPAGLPSAATPPGPPAVVTVPPAPQAVPAEPAPFALPLPESPAADPGPGGGVPPWWDPLAGAVVGAEPDPPTPRWWDPVLGEVVEPGAARETPAAPAQAAAPPPWPVLGAEDLADAAGLAEGEEEVRAEEPRASAGAPPGEARRGRRDSPFGGDPFSYAGRVLGRGLDELLGPGGDYGAQGGGEAAGGAGMMEVLVRIAEGVERLIEVVGESRGDGGPPGPGSVEGTRDFGYDDDAETPASPSVDLWGMPRPGKSRDAAGHPRAEAPKRQPHGQQE
jgi:hypothetical protein